MHHSRTRNIITLCALATTMVRTTAASGAIQPVPQIAFAAHRDGIRIVHDDGTPSAVQVRAADVQESFEHGAIRFTFATTDASALRTDVFTRVDGRRTTPVLGQGVGSELDLPGTYRADLRDASGTSVGWLRVQVSPFETPARVYDGRVPATVSEVSVDAALARLDADIDSIEAHATDVHIGS
jgi:hypothetical protein